jgi:hypothetical protein
MAAKFNELYTTKITYNNFLLPEAGLKTVIMTDKPNLLEEINGLSVTIKLVCCKIISPRKCRGKSKTV